MATINLLPWRETLREEQKKEFIILFGAVACFAILICIAIHFYMNYKIAYHQSRNMYLTSEISLLDVKIKEIKNLKKLKNALVTRMSIIQDLQLQRPRVVHLFDDMVNVLPKGIHFSKITLNSNQVSVDGISESNTSISRFMRNINDSRWLDDPRLSEIKTKEAQGTQINEFRLRATLTTSNLAEQKK